MKDYDHPLFFSLYKQAAVTSTPNNEQQTSNNDQQTAQTEKPPVKKPTLPFSDQAAFLVADQADKLIPGAGKWARENPTFAKALTFLGIPSIAALGMWAIGNAFDKSKKGPSFWSYLLPMIGVGGAAWWATSNITPRKMVLGDLPLDPASKTAK